MIRRRVLPDHTLLGRRGFEGKGGLISYQYGSSRIPSGRLVQSQLWLVAVVWPPLLIVIFMFHFRLSNGENATTYMLHRGPEMTFNRFCNKCNHFLEAQSNQIY